LAFTTIPGASATDATSFIGTEGVDVLNSFATLTGFVEGLGFADTITLGTAALAGTNSLTEWTVRAGSGNDTLDVTADINGGLFNGNQGGDTINVDSVFGGARILGGMDIDDIDVAGDVAFSSVNGNKGADTVDVNGGLLNASIFGGQGADTITVTATGTGNESSLISGDFGSDTINVSGSLVNSTIDGAEGNDVIDASGATGAVGTDAGLIINGGIGDDTLLGGAANDTISGGEGDDNIRGDGGIDVMTGGAGSDVFWGISAADVTNSAAPATDHITDFVTNVDDFVDAGGAAVTVTSGATYATVKDANDATALGAGFYNVAVGSNNGAGYSSYLIESDGATVVGIALINSIGQYTEAQAKVVVV
jgi:Ca2+-binding RTX toxin-like protein